MDSDTKFSLHEKPEINVRAGEAQLWMGWGIYTLLSIICCTSST